MTSNFLSKTTRIVMARSESPRYRKCKGCGTVIRTGQMCLRYKKTNKFSYHCESCAKRYNLGTWEIAIMEYNNYNNKVT